MSGTANTATHQHAAGITDGPANFGYRTPKARCYANGYLPRSPRRPTTLEVSPRYGPALSYRNWNLCCPTKAAGTTTRTSPGCPTTLWWICTTVSSAVPVPVTGLAVDSARYLTSTPNPSEWLRTLEHIAHDDTEHEFLRLWFGLCLTTETRDHLFLFLQGPGGGGKSILMNISIAVLGQYHVGLPADSFIGNSSHHPEWKARLHGARLTTISDAPRGRWRNLDLLKSIVSGDSLTANFMRRASFDFDSTAKVMLGGNHEPRLGYSDSGLGRRIVLVPAAKVKNPDKHLRHKLQAELAAITGWMVQAATDYLKSDGLPPTPPRWAENTVQYLESTDAIGAWFRDRCRHNPDVFTPAVDLIADYNAYTQSNLKNAESIYDWVSNSSIAGLTKKRQRIPDNKNPVWGYLGLQLTDQQHEGQLLL